MHLSVPPLPPFVLVLLYLLPVILLLLLLSIFVLLLLVFELFLCSRHVAAATVDNDVADYNIMLPIILYLLPPMDKVCQLLLAPRLSVLLILPFL